MSAQSVQLGPRASLLLGLLDHPMTASELLGLLQHIVDEDILAILDIDPLFGSPVVAIKAILDGGTDEVRRQLHRLEAAGHVGHLDAGAGASYLWWRT